ncbi:MAG: PAS domain-containing protein [Burkholderiales bacterium]|nr:PAS domain-containing protein [Burkholderiales bacterium]
MQSPQPPAAFLEGTGELGRLIAAFDWQATSLGAISTWPAHVRVSIALMLRSDVPLVTLWGEDGVMVYNDAYSVFAGRRHPQLLGSKVREGWAEVADFNDNVMRVGLAGKTLRYRDQQLTLYRNGRAEQVWMDLDYSPLVDGDGNAAGVMAIVVETTAKVRAMAHIRGESERMTQMFAQAPGFMAMLSGPSHVFELANASYMRLVGDREVVGRTVAEAIPEAADQGYIALLDQVFSSGTAYTADSAKFLVLDEPEGPPAERFVDFVYQPVRNQDGEVEGIFVQGVDVTSRVAADRRRETVVELRTHFQKAHSVADVGFAASHVLGRALAVSRVGYGSINADDDTLEVERDWCRDGVESLAGITPLRAYGSFIDSLKRNEFIAIPDVRLDDRTRDAAGALESKSARSFVNVPVMERERLVAVFFVNEDQPRNWSQEELTLIREVGERTRMAAERMRHETALREANNLLESKIGERTRKLMEVEAQFRQSQKMEAIGQLTGGIAHDFNNLLHGLGMSLEILKRMLESGNTDRWQRYVDMAQGSVRRAAALTQRMLAFSRRQTLAPRAVDLARLLQGLGDLVRSTAGPAISVDLSFPDGVWPTKVDASQLENAVINLCINARDAMLPAGGGLSIGLANVQLGPDEAGKSELPPGDYVELHVTDTGTGMTEDVRARAFDPFFTTKPQGEGTGLGLSMVYGFVRQSGGQVGIDSEMGRGTTVRLLLPRFMGETPAEAAEAKPAARIEGSGEVVLLVEDDPTIRPLLTEELERAGYHVIVCTRGAEGLDVLLSEARVDLLVTDVGLPGGLNGRQVADGGRATRPGLPVLFITGYANAAAAVGGGQLPAGMEVIIKPFDAVDFVRKVRAMV